ncbi:MAG TPA: tetratricopeptide repeat protein [Gaiellaceae bacterium]|nr:tetratricopeptide repeat protein [Gaiellaceae bacterium]HUJ56668.1 tetratricopeptide repeat protein [Gaiellaceae bacterium]
MSSRTQVPDPRQSQSKLRPRSSLSLGERIRSLRLEQRLTQQELAGEYCTKEYVSQIERGRARPTGEMLERLAERLAVDRNYLESGLSAGDYVQAEALVAKIEALVSSKRYGEAVEAAAEFTASPEAPELELRALLAEGWARMYEGELRTALERLKRARELAAASSFSTIELADALFRLGCCRYKLSSIGSAIRLFDDALELVERSELPSDRLRVDILGWRARCHRRQRDWVSARDDVERALELSRSLADPELEANTLFQASLISEREGNWIRARRLAEQARALYEQLDDCVNVGRQLNNLGGFEFLLGNTGRAVERLREAHELACRIGSTPDAAQALCSLAEVELSEQQHEQAEEHARTALAMLDGREDFLDVTGTAQLRLGKALLAQGRLDDAEAALGEAEATLAQLSSASHLAAVWSVRGELALARNNPDEAVRLYRRATEALQDFRF